MENEKINRYLTGKEFLEALNQEDKVIAEKSFELNISDEELFDLEEDNNKEE